MDLLLLVKWSHFKQHVFNSSNLKCCIKVQEPKLWISCRYGCAFKRNYCVVYFVINCANPSCFVLNHWHYSAMACVKPKCLLRLRETKSARYLNSTMKIHVFTFCLYFVLERNKQIISICSFKSWIIVFSNWFLRSLSNTRVLILKTWGHWARPTCLICHEQHPYSLKTDETICWWYSQCILMNS